MKLYLHINLGTTYNDQFVTAATHVQDVAKVDIRSCVEAICKALVEKERINLNPRHVDVIKTSKGRKVNLDADISTLSDGTDLIITLKATAFDPSTKFEKTVINKVKESSDLQQKTVATSSSADPADAALLKKANNAVSKKMNHVALALYQEVLEKDSSNHEALFGIAYIYFKAGRYETSVSYFEKLVSKDSSSYVVLLDYATALMRSEQESKAVSVISRCINDLKRTDAEAKSIHDANVALADALEAMEQLQSAFQLYLSVSQMTEKQHVNALLGYARVGYKLGHVTLDDVFIVVLNAVALRKNDTEIQKFFAEMIQETGGYDALQKQMHEAWNDAPAVVYIATFLRECGAMNHCLRLLKHAHKLAPKSVDIALLIVHLYENVWDLDAALDSAAKFVDSKHDRQVLRKIDLSCFAKVIRFYFEKKDEDLQQFVSSKLDVLKQSPKEASPVGSMTNLELQLLAIYFTVIKIFFIKGEMQPLPLLLESVKPLFSMNKDLHKTLIRNEQAFYSCISQMFDSYPPDGRPSHNQKLYIVGDSHALPLAWRNMKIKDVDYTTHPVLLTGLKIWHLRKESNFYTKRSYEKVVQQIPNGATCLFILGEIDCREGVQRAVQKCAYDSREDCILTLVEIYVKAVCELRKRKKLKIIVHPVPPVLKETKDTIKEFNRILKERVLKTPKLPWLDIVEELVDSESGFLKDEFVFDGAHLHPKYYELVEQNVQKYF